MDFRLADRFPGRFTEPPYGLLYRLKGNTTRTTGTLDHEQKGDRESFGREEKVRCLLGHQAEDEGSDEQARRLNVPE
jgi:hypothetical protein